MIDANDLIKKLKKEYYKTGYTLDERDEFKLVYNTFKSFFLYLRISYCG